MAKDVSQYINECLKLGIDNHTAICDRAKARIHEIDKELHKADNLRAEKIHLTNVLRELNDESVRRRRVIPDVPVIEFDDNSVEANEMRLRICKAIESEGPLANREIIQSIGGYNEEQRVIRAIKYLGERGILARDDERRHVQGPNWNQRPIGINPQSHELTDEK